MVVCSIGAAYPSLFTAIICHPSHTTADVRVKSEPSDLIMSSSITDVNVALLATTSSPVQCPADHFFRYVALSILLFFFALVVVVICGNNEWWATGTMKSLRLIFFVAFTKLPIKSLKKPFVQEIIDCEDIMEPDEGSKPEVTSNKK